MSQPSSQLFRKSALDRLNAPEQLDRLTTLTRPRGVVGLVFLTALAAAVVVWAAWGAVSASVSAPAVASSGREALVFVPPSAVGAVRVGRRVALTSPAGLFPPVEGVVVAFNPAPMTQARMMEVLGHDRLVAEFSRRGVPSPATVVVDGAAAPLPPGVRVAALIKLGERSPLSLLTPASPGRDDP